MPMKALYFQHQNAVVMHVETQHGDGRVTLTREPGSEPFITCPLTSKRRTGYAQLIADEPEAAPVKKVKRVKLAPVEPHDNGPPPSET